MNIFRLAGDLLHLLAIIILLLKILKTRSCAGISGRSQVLFALVYTTRYLDLFSSFISTYNSVMKVIFIGATYATLYLVYIKFVTTYSRNRDTFRIECLVIPVAILAYIINHSFDRLEVLWTFSIYLESVAILPQLLLVLKTGKAETVISVYLSCLGSYRALYILNWIYRYYSEGFYDLIAIIAGVVQTVIYSVFFCLYTTKDWSGWTDIIDTVYSDRNDEFKQCKILVKSDLALIDATPFLQGYKNGYEPLQQKNKTKQVFVPVHKASGVPYEMLLSNDDPVHSPCMTSSHSQPMSENHSSTKVIVLDKAEIKETGNPENLIKE